MAIQQPTPPPAPAETTVAPKHISTPPATLLIGPPGTGKTWSLSTYIEAGLELFVLITDPGGEEALIDAIIAKGLPLKNVHWAYVPASKMSWDSAKKIAQTVNTMSYESLGSMKMGLEKNSHKQFLTAMETLSNFKCARTGKAYGPVDSWGPDRVLAIDSMTGINKMIKRLVVGAKPTLHQGEWGTAMEIEDQFIDALVGNRRYFLCVIAHIEKTMDTTRGKPMLMASFLGSKLAPRIPSLFSDVVLSQREGSTFKWSTTAHDVDLKGRTLPLSNDIKPDFQQVVDGWKKREAAIAAALEEDIADLAEEEALAALPKEEEEDE